MRALSHTVRHLLRVALILGVVLGFASAWGAGEASAQTFDESCAPQRSVAPRRSAPRVALLIDDLSALPEHDQREADPQDPLTIIASAVARVAEQVAREGACSASATEGCDLAQLGVGFLSEDVWSVPPAEDASPAVCAQLDAHERAPNASLLQTGRALVSAATWATTGAPARVVLITAAGDEALEVEPLTIAINALCQARALPQALTTEIIQLGAAPSASLGVLAAAGGTGTCRDGAGASVDPCTISATALLAQLRTLSCDPPATAATTDALAQALTARVEAARCVFPVELPTAYTRGEVIPASTLRVRVAHELFGEVDVPHVATGGLGASLVARGVAAASLAARYEDASWSWADPEHRTVRLSAQLCHDVRAGQVARVSTQLACQCRYEGQDCAVPNARGRCAIGRYACVQGLDVCTPRYTAMPEVCNGLDDNCDGTIDNLASADPDGDGATPWSPATQPLDRDTQGAFCGFSDTACGCPDGPDTHGPTPGPRDDEWELFTSAYSGRCACAEPLSALSALAPALRDASPASRAEPAIASQGCAQGGSGAPAPHALLVALLLGLSGLVTRRD